MKNNRNVLLIILAFSILIGGAGILYNSLTKDYQPNSFVNLGENGQNIADTSNTAEEKATTENHNHPKETDSVQESKEETTNTESEEAKLQPAPDFTVYDSTGNQVKLSDYLGKPVVLNFWASWCGPCKSEMPGFDHLYQKYGDSVEFLMVNLTDGFQETQEKADQFIQSEGYSFPILYDHDSEAAYTYGISSIPTTFLVNEEGYVEGYAAGAISEEALENAIVTIFKP